MERNILIQCATQRNTYNDVCYCTMNGNLSEANFYAQTDAFYIAWMKKDSVNIEKHSPHD